MSQYSPEQQLDILSLVHHVRQFDLACQGRFHEAMLTHGLKLVQLQDRMQVEVLPRWAIEDEFRRADLSPVERVDMVTATWVA